MSGTPDSNGFLGVMPEAGLHRSQAEQAGIQRQKLPVPG